MEKIDAESLATMRDRGGDWFVYENVAFDSHQFGHLRFLKCGQGCTFETPPARYPDTPDCIGWRYLLKGRVDLPSGEVVLC